MISLFYQFFEDNLIKTDSASFKIVCELVTMDHPLIFICESNGSYYSFMEIEDNSDYFGWNICKVNLFLINEVNKGKKNIQSLFSCDEKYQLFFKDGEPNFSRVIDFVGKYSICGSLFKKDFCDMDEVFDYHHLLATSKAENKNKLAIICEEDGCKTGLFISAVNKLNDICNNLNSKLSFLTTTMRVQDLSTAITFTFNEDAHESEDILGKLIPSSQEGFNELGNLLLADEEDVLLVAKSKEKKEIFSKYRSLINLCGKNSEFRPKIVLSSSQDSIKSFRLDKENTLQKKKALNSALKSLKQNIEPKEENIYPIGILTAIDTTNTSRFKFKDNCGMTYSGHVDFSIMGVKNFDVNGSLYKASIKKIVSYLNGEIIKTSFVLFDLEFKEKVEVFKEDKLL